jgi:hypothetical protein
MFGVCTTVRRCRLAAVGVLLAAAVALPSSAGKASRRLGELRVEVRGFGSVLAAPSFSRGCRRRCTWRFQLGKVVRLRAEPRPGNRFSGWRGACSGSSGCSIRVTKKRHVVARFAPTAQPASWSQHVQCIPALTTLRAILGPQESPAGGASESGGTFQPHLAGAADKHLLNPPCAIGAAPTFVEVHDLVVSTAPRRSGDGDQVANLSDPNRAEIANPYMKTIHVEIDGTWIAAAVAPRLLPPLGTRIDVQGFVFWDPDHLGSAGHSYSGWELHPLAAWRPAR